MESLARRHQESRTDDIAGEVIDSGLSKDRQSMRYELRAPPAGTTREYDTPIRQLNVQFIADGLVELNENH